MSPTNCHEALVPELRRLISKGNRQAMCGYVVALILTAISAAYSYYLNWESGQMLAEVRSRSETTQQLVDDTYIRTIKTLDIATFLHKESQNKKKLEIILFNATADFNHLETVNDIHLAYALKMVNEPMLYTQYIEAFELFKRDIREFITAEDLATVDATMIHILQSALKRIRQRSKPGPFTPMERRYRTYSPGRFINFGDLALIPKNTEPAQAERFLQNKIKIFEAQIAINSTTMTNESQQREVQ